MPKISRTAQIRKLAAPLLKLQKKVFVKTDDNWHPNFEGDLVELSLLVMSNLKDWKVVVWGADDTGMEKEFQAYEEANEVYTLLAGCGNVNFKDLIDLGFTY